MIDLMDSSLSYSLSDSYLFRVLCQQFALPPLIIAMMEIWPHFPFSFLCPLILMPSFSTQILSEDNKFNNASLTSGVVFQGDGDVIVVATSIQVFG